MSSKLGPRICWNMLILFYRHFEISIQTKQTNRYNLEDMGVNRKFIQGDSS
jgi:hypothetical protein